MPTPQEVYEAIESELMYQERETINPDRPDMVEELSPGDHLLAMEHCLAEARAAWYSGFTPHTEAAEFVRKVTAMGVRFMQTFDAPRRS